jgi:hypothetical protein
VLARYEAPSSLAYSELVLVRGRAPRGWRVEALFADLEASVRGGRELFGVAKELAAFGWGERAVEVRRPDGGLVARLRWSAPRARLPLPALGTVLGAGRTFRVGGLLHVGPVRAEVDGLPAHARPLLALAGRADVRAGAIRAR